MTVKRTLSHQSQSAAELLGRVPYFQAQDGAAVAALAAAARSARYPAGAVIFLQDEPVSGLYVVATGVVKICRLSAEGREHILHLAQPGETFNDVAVLDGEPNPATAIAQTDVLVWHIRRSDLQQIAVRYPALAWAMAESIAGRARFLVGLVEDLAMRSVKGRLARLLIEASRTHESDAVPRLLTQEEMANQLGTVREMVSRVLRSLAAAGIIEFDRHRIVILDPERLAREAAV